jgi:hypothetical protein
MLAADLPPAPLTLKNTPGSPLVTVTDSAANPVDAATVIFRLGEGPAVFHNGLKTDIVTSSPDGAARIPAIDAHSRQPISLRVTASKGEARAGMLITIEPKSSTQRQPVLRARHSRRMRWIATAAAGAAAGLLASGYAKTNGPANQAAAPPAAVTVTPLQIGPPVVTIGKP